VSNFLAAIIIGITIGSTLTLVGLGLVLIFRATDTFNFAHGEFMALGAFLVGYWQAKTGLPFAIALVLSLVATSGVGGITYRLVLSRTIGLPMFMPVIATLGVASIMDGVFQLWFGANQYIITIPGMPGGVADLGGVRVATATLVLTAAGFIVAGCCTFVFMFTGVGRLVRAAGQDALLASQGGINVGRTYFASWCVATGLAALAGVLYGSTNLVSTGIVSVALLAFPAMVLGGLDSIPGAIVGGIGIGIVQGFTATYLSGDLTDAVTYSILLVFLLVRPNGIFGTARVRRV
jgi:branched-chain amino acid transport system permease protein